MDIYIYNIYILSRLFDVVSFTSCLTCEIWILLLRALAIHRIFKWGGEFK